MNTEADQNFKIPKPLKIIVVSICFAIILLTIVSILVFLPNCSGGKIDFDSLDTYYYGVTTDNNNGVKLISDWTKGLKFKDFDLTITGVGVEINDNFKLTASTPGNSEAHFSYKGKLIVKIYITAVEEAVIIDSEEKLLSISSGVYIQDQHIRISKANHIKEFVGTYYGNYNVISGLDISSGGSLIQNVRNSQFYSVVLENVKGTVTANSGGSFGALANNSYSSLYFGIYASGVVNYQLNSTDKYYIGGILGQLKHDMRISEDTNIYQSAITECSSKLEINVNTIGTTYLGGIVGSLENLSIQNCVSDGTIRATTAPTGSDRLILGGIVGSMSDAMPSAGLHVTSFIMALSLKCTSTIILESYSNFGENYVGGIIGAIANVNISKCSFAGVIRGKTEMATFHLGGILGNVSKSAIASSIEMYMELSDSSANILLSSGGIVYAGGIVGFGETIVIYDNCTSTANISVEDRTNGESSVKTDTVRPILN
jgi:hypothetical protein